MALKTFKATNAEVSTLQTNVETALLDLSQNPLRDTNLVADVALTTTNREVRHGLTGPPRGWIVVKAAVAVTVYSDTASSAPTEIINLKSSVAATVSLLFF